MMRFTLISGALLAMLAACARSPTSDKQYRVGQTAEVDGWQITVHSVIQMAGTEDRQPMPGHVFCAVEVTLENRSDSIRFFMPERQMTLMDDNGTLYELDHNAAVMAARSHGWTVPDGEVSVGEIAHGAASYQIPADAQGLSWVFRSSLLPGAPNAVFDLGSAPR